MLTEPEEHPLTDVFSDLAQNHQARQLFWDQVEALRGHLLRAVLGIMVGVGISFTFAERLVQFLAVPVGGLDSLRATKAVADSGVMPAQGWQAGLAMGMQVVQCQGQRHESGLRSGAEAMRSASLGIQQSSARGRSAGGGLLWLQQVRKSWGLSAPENPRGVHVYGAAGVACRCGMG